MAKTTKSPMQASLKATWERLRDLLLLHIERRELRCFSVSDTFSWKKAPEADPGHDEGD